MSNAIKLSLISVALLSQLNADNQYTLDAIHVSSSQGTTLKKKDVTDSVVVITKEAIDESRATTLGDALSKLGNITISQSGGTGQQTSMFLRGMDTRRILILIDGVRYNNPTAVGGVAELSQIMLYNVEQIEIIKGAQSGVWGSDASGGVINIITSKAKKGIHAVANIEYGSFDSKKTSLQASYATKKYDILVGGLYIDNEGFSATEPKKGNVNYGKRYDELGLEKDAYLNKSFNTKLGYNFTDKDRIEASVQLIDSNVKFDSGAGIDDTVPNSKVTNTFYSLAYKHNTTLHDIKLQYNLSTFDRVSIYGAFPASVYKGSVNEVKIDDKIDYMKNSFLRVGVSYQLFKQEDITANTDKSYSATSAFVTNYNKINLLSDVNTIITESVRYDQYDEFDNSLTGKLGIKQFINDDYFVSLNIGTGYNAPTLGQLYGQFGANPNLKPEKSLTTDLTIGNDTVWITGFYNEITDFIGSDNFYNYIQIAGTSKFQGIELGYEDYFFDNLGINAMYTYVKTKDAEGKELARRPESQLDARATYYVSQNLDVGLNAQYIGLRYDKKDKAGAQTGKYIVTNFVTNFKVNKYLTFYGKIDNITDKYYQVVDGYATAGRSFYLGLVAKY
jgi:vitamin B12 transporter